MPNVVGIVRTRSPRQPTTAEIRRRAGRRFVTVVALAATAIVGCSQRPEFAKFVPTVDAVPRLTPTTKVQLGGWVPEVFSDCDAVNFKYVPAHVDPNSSGWKVVIQHDHQAKDESERDVAFATIRFPDRDAFDEQWKTFEKWFSQSCLSPEDGITTVDPITIDGLPANSLTASWPDPAWDTFAVGLSTIIADPDGLTMMFVVWKEGPQPISTDDYVAVVNAAWTEFQANN